MTLPVSITPLAFGKLPTPTLGEGCTSCTSGVHVTLPITGQIEVEATDKYFLKATVLIDLLCAVIGLCAFEGKDIKVPILHTGKHPNHSGENLALIEFTEVPLPKEEGSALCGSVTKLDADYVIFLAHPPTGEPGLAWPSLDKKV